MSRLRGQVVREGKDLPTDADWVPITLKVGRYPLEGKENPTLFTRKTGKLKDTLIALG